MKYELEVYGSWYNDGYEYESIKGVRLTQQKTEKLQCYSPEPVWKSHLYDSPLSAADLYKLRKETADALEKHSLLCDIIFESDDIYKWSNHELRPSASN